MNHLFVFTIFAGLFGSPLFLNAEEGLKFLTKRLTVDANEGIAIADVDRDGLPDIISGRNWFRAPEFVPYPLRTIEDWNGYTTSNGDFAYDVNQDGWMDVVAGGFLKTEIEWFENPKLEGLQLGQVWSRQTLVDTGLSQNEGNLWTDLDQDGIPELLVNSWNRANPLCAWELSSQTITEQLPAKNKKDPPTTIEKVVPAMTKILLGEKVNGHGLAVGDLNSDGRDDILVGDGWYEQPANWDQTKPWEYHSDWSNLHAAVPCIVHDVNGDGKQDLIWAKGHDYGIYWWEITGQNADGSLAWIEHEIDKSFSQAHALELADLDGDGRVELITGKRYRAHNGRDPGGNEPALVYYYQWNPDGSKFTRYEIENTGNVGIGLQIRVADLNGDGKPDLALAGKSGTHILFNQGTVASN